jgi:hypothetical protein
VVEERAAIAAVEAAAAFTEVGKEAAIAEVGVVALVVAAALAAVGLHAPGAMCFFSILPEMIAEVEGATAAEVEVVIAIPRAPLKA